MIGLRKVNLRKVGDKIISDAFYKFCDNQEEEITGTWTVQFERDDKLQGGEERASGH